MKILRSSALPLIVLAFTLAACTKHTQPSAQNKILVFARPADSVDFDPGRTEDGESINVGENMFEGLVRFKQGTTEIEPCLAEKWEISKDGRKYTFHLRHGVQFHDGTPFNADAVVFAVKRQYDKRHPGYASGVPYRYWETMAMQNIIADVKKIDNLTVEFDLKKPNSPFLADLAMYFMEIPSPTAILKYQRDFDMHPVGTGPYTLKSWKKDDALELEAFPNYWGPKAKIKNVVVRVIPDNEVRLLELRKGAVQIIDYPNLSDLPALKNDPDIKLLQQNGLDVAYLAFNLKKPPFNRYELREAIALGVDRKRIVDALFQGFGSVAKNPMPPFMLGYDHEIKDYEYNPEKAKALLTKAGLTNLTLELWVPPVARPYDPNPQKMAEFIQADLRRIGIETKIVSYDWGTYLEKVGNGEHQMCLIGWNGDTGDPDNFLFPLWSKDAAETLPTQNYAFWEDDQATKWMKDAEQESDRAKRTALYKKIQERIHQEIPALFIDHSIHIVPVRKEVEGYMIEPTSAWRFSEVSFAHENPKM